MNSVNNYQEIKTPDELEEQRSIEGIYQELLENAIEDSDGRPINAYVRMNLMQRARKIYSERVKEEEENEL